jgi:hypothetical protein
MQAGWREAESRNTNYPGADPYLEWATGAGRTSYFLPGRQDNWLPVLVLLRGITAKEFASGENLPVDFDFWKISVRVPDFYVSAPEVPGEQETYCTALVTEHFFELLNDNETLRNFVPQITLGLPLGAESLPLDMREVVRDKLKGKRI